MKKSIFKIIKQIRIKHKLKKIHSKCLCCSDCVRAFCKNKPMYCYGPHDW